MCNCCKVSNVKKEPNPCPKCKVEGLFVPFKTVENLVMDELKKELQKESKYFICKNPNCDVVYFNSQKAYTKENIKVPIWFKDESLDVPICYCSNVTRREIIREVAVDKTSKTVEDIIKNTGAMKNPNCLMNNPLGKCCHKAIEDEIKKAMEYADNQI